MQITFSEDAVQQINRALARGVDGLVKLVYDSEGCGCAVNGVPTLWLADEPESNDFAVEGSPFRIWMDKKHEVFFEERMTVDYKPANLSFVLKSGSQTYNAHMKLVDHRKSGS
jgi:uncharacterized protein YqkB